MENGKPIEEGDDVQMPPPPAGGIEREVLGKWTVLLRNLGGILSVVVVCLMGLFNSYSIWVSVSQYNLWPSEMSMFIMVVGPVVVSWQFMNVSKTLTAIFSGADSLSRLRTKAAKIIAPSPEKG